MTNRQKLHQKQEDPEQIDYLRHHGCDAMQGYYFSRPVPAEAFAGLLREKGRLSAPQRA